MNQNHEVSRGEAPVNGTTLYWERHGSGPPFLLLHGGAEDSAAWRWLAEALAQEGFCSVTFDRRGTGRSGREGWPEGGVEQHADDAARLLEHLRLIPATCLGGSTGAVIALALALRHPEHLTKVYAYEPALLNLAPNGEELHARMSEVAAEYLARRPGDWGGAYREWVEISSEGRWNTLPEWRRRREALNAESFFKDDLPIITRYSLPPSVELRTEVRILYGSRTLPFLRDIAVNAARVLSLDTDVLDGADHNPYLDRAEDFARYLALGEATT
jgi:pimeloyl-ACP methyl ester carboxylesterase